MVDKSAGAVCAPAKMLIDMMKGVEQRAVDASPPPEPRRLAAADKEVVQLFVGSSRGCEGRSCKRSQKQRRRSLPDSPAGFRRGPRS